MKRNTLAVLAVIAGVSGPALAHAFLERAIPSAGETLRGSPTKVALRFSEPLEPAFSDVRVSAADGRDMSSGNAIVRGTDMELPLKRLLPGRYLVTWHVLSVDTHRTEGKYKFLVVP